jgi:hypothetical protein
MEAFEPCDYMVYVSTQKCARQSTEEARLMAHKLVSIPDRLVPELERVVEELKITKDSARVLRLSLGIECQPKQIKEIAVEVNLPKGKCGEMRRSAAWRIRDHSNTSKELKEFLFGLKWTR